MDTSSVNGKTSISMGSGSVTSLLNRSGTGKVQNSDALSTNETPSANTVLPSYLQQSNDATAIGNAVKKLNEVVAPALQTLQFSMDQDTHRIVVKVVDTETNKVIRQIPNEEVLAISKSLERLQGLFVNQKA